MSLKKIVYLKDIVNSHEGDTIEIVAPDNLTSMFKATNHRKPEEYSKDKEQEYILRGLKMDGNEYLIGINFRDTMCDYTPPSMGRKKPEEWRVHNILFSLEVQRYDEEKRCFVTKKCPKEMNTKIAVYKFDEEHYVHVCSDRIKYLHR